MAVLSTQLQQYLQKLQRTALFNPSIFFLAVLCLIHLLIKLSSTASKRNFPPSPPKLPLIGNLHQLGLLPHRSLRALSRKYGPLMLLHLGRTPTLVVSSAEMACEIMKIRDAEFANRHVTWTMKELLYGCEEIAFSPYCESWRKFRKFCITELLNPRKLQSFNYIREEETTDLITRLQNLSLQKVPINLGQMLNDTTTNIICRCILGRKYCRDDDPKFGKFTETILRLLLAFSFRDYFPCIGWIDKFTGLDRKVRETFEVVDHLLDDSIKEQKHLKHKGEQSEKKSFIQILLNPKNDSIGGCYVTQKSTKGILLDMLVGGNNTTSTTVEWAMTGLVKCPNLMKKAQEEVRRVVGRKARVDFTDLNQMEFLKSVIKETLRLHPAAPLLLPRETSTWIKLKGYDLPPKTTVFVNVFAIQRGPRLWDMPEEFRPERFHNSPIDFTGQHFKYTPFGAGRRICPGISFTNATMEYVLANLLYWFDWDLPRGETREDLDMTEVFGVATKKKNPLHLVPTRYCT